MKILVREFNEDTNKLAYVWKDVVKTKPIKSGYYKTTDNADYEAFLILKIEKDYRRLGYVICSGCGEVIKEGKEEKHYLDRESNANCAKCEKLTLRPIDGKRKVTLLPDGTAISRTVNNPYCSARGGYRIDALGDVNKQANCIYYKCRRYGTEQIPSDFLSEHPNPYKFFPTETTAIATGWEFHKRGTGWTEYATKNGKLIATFDTNGILNYFTVFFRDRGLRFKYSDRYDKYIAPNGMEFRWGDMAERTRNGYKKAIRSLYV